MRSLDELIRASDYPVQLRFPKALQVMQSAQYRLSQDPDDPSHCPDLQIRYRNLWWDVGRTDLFDNVATSSCETAPLNQLRAHYIAKLSRTKIGVRLNRWSNTRRSFSIVDSMTDG